MYSLNIIIYWTRWSLYHIEWKSKIAAKSLCTVWQYISAHAALPENQVGQHGQRCIVRVCRAIWMQFWIFILYGIEIIWSNIWENRNNFILVWRALTQVPPSKASSLLGVYDQFFLSTIWATCIIFQVKTIVDISAPKMCILYIIGHNYIDSIFQQLQFNGF